MSDRPLFNYYFLKQIPFLRRFLFNHLKKWIKENPDRNNISEIINNVKMNLYVNDWVQQNLFLHGVYEKNETEYWLNKAKRSKVVFDIGSNVGYYSLIIATQIDNNKGVIYAFEPVQKIFERLNENISLNKFQSIIAVNKVVSDSKGTVRINSGNSQNWGMSSINQHGYLSGHSEEVEKISLDSFCFENRIEHIDLVKIDVEGEEFNVLKGMKGMIKKAKPEILMEIVDHNMVDKKKQVEELYEFLWSNGYRSFKINENCNLTEIKVPHAQEGLVCFKAD